MGGRRLRASTSARTRRHAAAAARWRDNRTVLIAYILHISPGIGSAVCSLKRPDGMQERHQGTLE